MTERSHNTSKPVRRKNGFSVAETVIAMSVILSVTCTALSVILGTERVFKDSFYRSRAVQEVKNALECFKASDGEIAERYAALENFAAFGLAEDDPQKDCREKNFGDHTVKVTITKNAEERLCFRAEIVKSGRAVYALDYIKG